MVPSHPPQDGPREIRVQFRTVYGVERIYPVCDTGRLFSRISRRETFSVDDLRVLAKLGYHVITVEDPRHTAILEGSTDAA